MDRIVVEAGSRTPYIDFDFPARRLLLRGESYPEDTAAFFGPLLQALRDFLAGISDGELLMEVELLYFNSSSAKALMNIFRMLEKAARDGVAVTIQWGYYDDDESMQESGEDFAEDFEAARFLLCAIRSSS